LTVPPGSIGLPHRGSKSQASIPQLVRRTHRQNPGTHQRCFSGTPLPISQPRNTPRLSFFLRYFACSTDRRADRGLVVRTRKPGSRRHPKDRSSVSLTQQLGQSEGGMYRRAAAKSTHSQAAQLGNRFSTRDIASRFPVGNRAGSVYCRTRFIITISMKSPRQINLRCRIDQGPAPRLDQAL
jgi:hypothetical protein